MNYNIPLTNTNKVSEETSSSRPLQDNSPATSPSIPNSFGNGLATAEYNLSQNLLKDPKSIEALGYNQVTNVAYVPVAFPSYAGGYAPNAIYGYAPNGTPSLPLYSYNPQLTEKDKEAWIANNISSSSVPASYVAANPRSWNADRRNQVLNAGITTNGLFPGNLSRTFQNGAQIQNPALRPNGTFVPNVFFYQNANPRHEQINDMRKSFQATNISGNLLGQESSPIPPNGFGQNGLNNLIPDGLSHMIRPDANVDPLSLQSGLQNGVKNQQDAIPFAVSALQNKGIQTGNLSNLPNEIAIANGMPLIVPTLFPPFADSSLASGIQNIIPATLVPQNIIPGYVGKTPAANPQSAVKPLDNVAFVNVQNDVIFDPLTQTPLLWNNLTRTPLMINPMKDEDISMISLPREIQPPHFLNVYPITGVTMPTLIPTSPIVKPKKSSAEDLAKKKYACKYCSKRFSRPSSLQTHTYSHTGERPFPCTLPNCGRSFSVLSNLRRHLQVCQKNLSKRVQLNDFIQQSGGSESAHTTSIEEKTPTAEKSSDNISKDEQPVMDPQNIKPRSSSNEGTSSSNFNGSNSDTRSTDSGSEETKNDSGLGGSVSSKGSRGRGESALGDSLDDCSKLKSQDSKDVELECKEDQMDVKST